jgi:ATP-binding cassette subfamily B protein
VLTPKFKKAAAQLTHLPRTLRLIWASSRAWTVAWAALLILQGLLPAVQVLLTREVVNQLSWVFNFVRREPTGLMWEEILLYAGLLALTLLGAELLGSAAAYVRAAQSALVSDHIAGLIQEKSSAADLAFYDSPDFYDHLHRARSEASFRPLALLESLGGMLRNTLTLAAMGVLLSGYSVWLPALLLLSALPAFFVALRAAVEQHRWRQRVTPDERRAWYYDYLLTSPESAAELRLFSLGGHFRALHAALRSRIRGESLALARRQGFAQAGASMLALAAAGFAMLWVLARAAEGLVRMGDIVLFYQAFQQGQSLMRSLLGEAAGLYQNSLFLGNLFEFLDLQPRVVSGPGAVAAPARVEGGVEFRGVTFAYPGSGGNVMERFSLRVKPGEIAALVGPNGAGKSTAVKLLCRFYDPVEGAVLIDGRDLREYDVESLRSRIAVLFQDPVRYNDTVRGNLAAARLDASDRELRDAARAAGADSIIDTLPGRYDQILGRWFLDGHELSAGQWQRIALARAYLRAAPLILLDEPTSMMDPWAEAAWLDRFRSLAEGSTALLVTHRFTTARLADTIHVMDGGRVRESGTHEELVRQGGLYAEWWQSQRVE